MAILANCVGLTKSQVEGVLHGPWKHCDDEGYSRAGTVEDGLRESTRPLLGPMARKRWCRMEMAWPTTR